MSYTYPQVYEQLISKKKSKNYEMEQGRKLGLSKVGSLVLLRGGTLYV